MIHRPTLLTTLVLWLLCATAWAAHITDKLVVGLYPAPTAEDAPLRLLASGTPLEVLDRRDGFVEVRLADDSVGWIESRYVTDEKPAKAQLLETQARLRQTRAALAALQQRVAERERAVPADGRGADPVPLLNPAEALAFGFASDSAVAGPAEQAAQPQNDAQDPPAPPATSHSAPQSPQTDPAGPADRQWWLVGIIALGLGFVGGRLSHGLTWRQLARR